MSIVSFCETSSEVKTPRNMKRKYEYDDTCFDDYGLPRHCAKRQRSSSASTSTGSSTSANVDLKAWEDLSRVWLTKRALDELNWRTFEIRMPDPVDASLDEIVPVESIDIKALKRFARQGGPDLRDLRLYPYSVPNWHHNHTENAIIKDLLRDHKHDNLQQKQQQSHTRNIGDDHTTHTHTSSTTVEIEGASSTSLHLVGPMTPTTPTTPTTSEIEQWRADEFDANFEQLLIDRGVYPPDCDYTLNGYPEPKYPANWDEIVYRAKQRRPSVEKILMIGVEGMEMLENSSRLAWTEREVEVYTFPDITGEGEKSITAPWPEDDKEKGINYGNQRKNEMFDNLEPFFTTTATATTSLPHARPSLYDGISPERLDPQILYLFDKYISPSTDPSAPILPNFFAECKGRLGDYLVAERQALYDGILGARAMRILQSTWNDGFLVFDDNAYTIVSTFRAGELELYTVHSAFENGSGRTEYRMNLIGRWYLLESTEGFREGVCAFRNLRDWAREQREMFVDRVHWEICGS